jgi:hypothetical protein
LQQNGEKASIVPLLAKANGEAVQNLIARRDSDENEKSLGINLSALTKQSSQETKRSSKSARNSKSELEELDHPQSIIPTKGQKADINKFKGRGK